ncbi:MAG TPA: hypothetical protein V6D00_13880 [Pantanalinema sp.]
MKLSKLFVSAAALSLAIAGCAVIPVTPDAPGVATAPQTAPALSLKIDWGRRVQAVASDVAGATVSLTVADRTFVAQATPSIAPAPVASPTPSFDGPPPPPSEPPILDAVDFSRQTGSELVPGDARVRVEAYDKDGRVIGVGDAVVPLLVGRRSYVQVHVKLDSTGRSDYMPLTPLGPQPSPGWVPSPEPAP